MQGNMQSILNVHQGVRFLPGFFNETLPGPVKQLALLRLDSDLFASTFETLEKMYPLISHGGWVVLDDWKISQARCAVILFRKRQNISAPIFMSSMYTSHPFQTLDEIAFWQKDSM